MQVPKVSLKNQNNYSNNSKNTFRGEAHQKIFLRALNELVYGQPSEDANCLKELSWFKKMKPINNIIENFKKFIDNLETMYKTEIMDLTQNTEIKKFETVINGEPVQRLTLKINGEQINVSAKQNPETRTGVIEYMEDTDKTIWFLLTPNKSTPIKLIDKPINPIELNEAIKRHTNKLVS